jgi:C4-dicarboxylate-specific signal transduction histidine kinase
MSNLSDLIIVLSADLQIVQANKEFYRILEVKDNLVTIIERVNHSSSIIRSLKGFASKVKEEVTPVRINVIIFDVLSFLDAQLLLSDINVDLALDENDYLVLGQEVRI